MLAQVRVRFWKTCQISEPPGLPAPDPASPITLRRLKWITVLAALVFILLLEAVRRALYPYLPSIEGRLLMGAAVFTGCLFFFGALFGVLERMQARLELRNRELLALHEATLGIYGELALDTVLQKVVDRACNLVNAQYGALSVINDQNRIESFITSGISDEERALIGPPPWGTACSARCSTRGTGCAWGICGATPIRPVFPPTTRLCGPCWRCPSCAKARSGGTST